MIGRTHQLPSPSRCRRLQCMDQLGSVPLFRTGAELLLEVFSQRCERGSILVNINLAVNERTGSSARNGSPGRCWAGSPATSTSWR